MRTLRELQNLKGRRALITGACGLLGTEIALTLAELGCDLTLLDLVDSEFEKTTSKIQEISKVKVDLIQCDLEKEKSRDKAIEVILEDTKNLEIIINNAAFVGSSSLEGWNESFERQTLETWNRALEVNLSSIFHLSQALSTKLRERGKGSIINIASIYGFKAPDLSLYKGTSMGNPAAYAASKGGVIQLTRWLATTLAKDIRVNSISPGGVFNNQPKEFINRYEAQVPLKRMASPEDIKGIIAYLASDLSEYVTGQNFVIDGGWSV